MRWVLVVLAVVGGFCISFPVDHGVKCILTPGDLHLPPTGVYVLPQVDWIWYPSDTNPWYSRSPTSKWRLDCEGSLKGSQANGSLLVIDYEGEFNFTLSNNTFSSAANSSAPFSAPDLRVPDDGVYPFWFQYYKSSSSGRFGLYWRENGTLSLIGSESFVQPLLLDAGFCGLMRDKYTGRSYTAFLPDTNIAFQSSNPFNSVVFKRVGVQLFLFGVFVPPHQGGYQLYQFSFHLDDGAYIVMAGSKFYGYYSSYGDSFQMYLEGQKPVQILIYLYDDGSMGSISFSWKNANYSSTYHSFSNFMRFPNISEGNIKCESYFSCDKPSADLLTISFPQKLISASLTVKGLSIEYQSSFSLINSFLTVNGNVSVMGSLIFNNSGANIHGSLDLWHTATLEIPTSINPIQVSQYINLDGSLILNYVVGRKQGTIFNSTQLLTGKFKDVTVVGYCSSKANMKYYNTLVEFEISDCGSNEDFKWIILGVVLAVCLIVIVIAGVGFYLRSRHLKKLLSRISSAQKHAS